MGAIPGSLEAIALLTEAGYDVFVASNQAGIARGKLTESALDKIHEKMFAEVEAKGGQIKDVKYCPHHPDDHCDCRKPEPGLLLELAASHGLDITSGHFVGDSLKDLRAAENAGCIGVLVLTGNGEETHRVRPHHEPTFKNLLEFAKSLTATD